MSAQKQKQGVVKHLKHESRILKNNPLNDPHVRNLYVYLPPDYDEQTEERYPTVYVLTGFTGRGRMLLNDHAFQPNFAERMDLLINDGKIRPMIAVLPDCFTRYGGAQYINSAATGDYEYYLTEEIVSFVDKNFKTISDKNSRAVMGKSSGGYGALVCGLRRADRFGLICATSGDCYFEHCYLPDIPKAFRAIKGEPQRFLARFFAEEKKGKSDFAGLNIIGMSACYSPNPQSELGFDLPFDLKTGEILPEIWQRWLAHDPVRLCEKYAENLKSLKLLFIDAGTRDEFFLDIGARILSDKLNQLGVSHFHEEFDDGHFSISYRQNRSLEMISNALD